MGKVLYNMGTQNGIECVTVVNGSVQREGEQ